MLHKLGKGTSTEDKTVLSVTLGQTPLGLERSYCHSYTSPPTAGAVFQIFPPLLFSSLAQQGRDCWSQVGQGACRGLGTEAGRGSKRRGRRRGGGLQ